MGLSVVAYSIVGCHQKSNLCITTIRRSGCYCIIIIIVVSAIIIINLGSSSSSSSSSSLHDDKTHCRRLLRGQQQHLHRDAYWTWSWCDVQKCYVCYLIVRWLKNIEFFNVDQTAIMYAVVNLSIEDRTKFFLNNFTVSWTIALATLCILAVTSVYFLSRYLFNLSVQKHYTSCYNHFTATVLIQSRTYYQCYFSLLTVTIIFFIMLITPVCGGSCWSSMMRNGRCTELLSERVSREECCASDSVTTAYSKDDLDPGTLFFWRVLGGGVPCSTCKQTCAGVVCGEGKKCVQRKSGPKCVCSPECKLTNGASKGPVCGTDGRSYRTLCRLRKRACRRRSHTLSVAYYGHCQSSCDKIKCPAGKHCLVDQNLSPHCVRCSRNCTNVTGKGRQVCGADGVTYPSACHLREAACQKGKAIPVAYKGRCKQTATCGNVRCKERQSCLSDIVTGAPRCVTCSPRCPRPRSRSLTGTNGITSSRRKGGGGGGGGMKGNGSDMGGPICGTNNRTYYSWCHMLKDACATGYIIETKHSGSCHRPNISQHQNLTTAANSIFDTDKIS